MPHIELLPTRDVAARLGVHPRTVHRWVRSGALVPAQVLPGYRGDYLFEEAEIERVLADRSPAGRAS